MTTHDTSPLGLIMTGSLTEGFLMRITNTVPLEHLKTGKFVSIQGSRYTFFCMITDLKLEVTNPDILLFPPTMHESLLKKQLLHHDMYATAHLKPMVMLNTQHHVMPVKTIPAHFSAVHEATEHDVGLIFGLESDKSGNYFNIGNPLDMQAPVCINLERLTERSNGIFGKTGTGKTFITRLLLAGLIKSKKAVTLIFDMHSEYGLQARKEGGQGHFVKGLKTLFNNNVVIFSLDPESTRRRGSNPDVTIQIPYQAINVEDILCLQEELNLHATAIEAAYLINARYKRNWLATLLQQQDRLKEFAQEIGAHPESVSALFRKLKRIERFPFLVDQPNATHSVIDQMMEYLSQGISVIVEFGNFTSTFCYLLIANIITRRIHSEYIERTEQFLLTQRKEDEPKKLLICIEEAHKFLNASAAKQTIFGIIAREMRKYYVSLLIVDQRPSGIDEEVLSQVGTKIIAQLNDEKDIQAVLTGTANASTLRCVLSSLDSKKQALVLGHAITMPVVIETREYNETFYEAMNATLVFKNVSKAIDELY